MVNQEDHQYNRCQKWPQRGRGKGGGTVTAVFRSLVSSMSCVLFVLSKRRCGMDLSSADGGLAGCAFAAGQGARIRGDGGNHG
jgi:hypothetical protein